MMVMMLIMMIRDVCDDKGCTHTSARRGGWNMKGLRSIDPMNRVETISRKGLIMVCMLIVV